MAVHLVLTTVSVLSLGGTRVAQRTVQHCAAGAPPCQVGYMRSHEFTTGGTFGLALTNTTTPSTPFPDYSVNRERRTGSRGGVGGPTRGRQVHCRPVAG